MIKIHIECQYDDFSLKVKHEFPSNRITGLFGQSGCGKSKLLRQVLGFDLCFQNQSEIYFNSNNWQSRSKGSRTLTEKRGIGYLPQSVDLFSHLTVKDNILFSFFNRVYDEALYERVLEELNLSHLTHRLPSQLSGGQKQRVGLARAIISAQNLLVLDEPFSAIGEDHKPKILKLLKELNASKKLPIIFSSHSRYEHAYLTEHLVYMEDGRVLLSGDYTNISTDITNKFAQAADAINHITATAIDFHQDYSLNCLETSSQKLWVGHEPIVKNTLVNLEIRAKDISISLNPINDSSMLNTIKTTLVNFHEIPNFQYLLKLKFENSYLIAFITKKSFIDLQCQKEMDLFASFKSVNVISI